MTTTWPRYRDCEEQAGHGYGGQNCAYTHDCGQHHIEQEGRRLGCGEESYPRGPGHAEAQASEPGPQGGGRRGRERRGGEERRHGGEERARHHRSERHVNRVDREPEPPPPPPPEPLEQPSSKAPQLSSLPPVPSAVDCADCALAQAQVQAQGHVQGQGQGQANGQPGGSMEIIESINPGEGWQDLSSLALPHVWFDKSDKFLVMFCFIVAFKFYMFYLSDIFLN